MKYIKFLFLLLFILFLSGCDIKYNVNFKKNSVVETLNISFIKNDGNSKMFEKQIEEKVKEYSEIYHILDYDYKYKEKKGKAIVNIKIIYSDIKKFSKSNSHKLLFENLIYDNENNKHNFFLKDIKKDTFDTSYSYAIDNPFNITINSSYRVSNANYYKKEDKSYYWNVSENNIKPNIYFTLDKKINFKDYFKNEKIGYLYFVFPISLFIFLIIVFIKKKNVNSI